MIKIAAFLFSVKVDLIATVYLSGMKTSHHQPFADQINNTVTHSLICLTYFRLCIYT